MFGMVQRVFQFTRPDDVDAQISYLINPRKILIIYCNTNIATFNGMPWSNIRFMHADIRGSSSWPGRQTT